MDAAIEHANLWYHQWDLPSKLTALAVPLVGAAWWIIKRDHTAVKTASLEIKQVVTAIFTKIVVEETRRLLKLLDDHLPEALSQSTAVQPHRSRFDHFCDALRTIPAEELERNKYKELIKDSFAGIIDRTISLVMGAAEATHQTATGDLFNTSDLRLELSGTIHLRLVFVSYIQSRTAAMQRRYDRCNHFSLLAFIISACCLFLLWIPFFSDTKWAWHSAVTLLITAMVLIPSGLFAVYLGHRAQVWLQEKSAIYRDKSRLENELTGWMQGQSE